MSNLKEKVEFSSRLKKALSDLNHPISPTFLSNEFNFRYSGAPVSVQSANNWLLGKAIPNQDKLLLLANWLNVSSQWLRFGDANSQSDSSLPSSDPLDIDLFLKLKKLNLRQKLLIQKIIDEFIEN